MRKYCRGLLTLKVYFAGNPSERISGQCYQARIGPRGTRLAPTGRIEYFRQEGYSNVPDGRIFENANILGPKGLRWEYSNISDGGESSQKAKIRTQPTFLGGYKTHEYS